MSIKHKMAILTLAAYYEKELSDEQVLVYSNQLSRSLSDSEANAAVEKYTDDPKNEFFPRPISKLIEIIKKPIDNKDQAQNILSLIKLAIKRHGHNWSDGYFHDYQTIFKGKDCSFLSFDEAAKSEIGDAGLAVTKRMGGWKHLCNFYYNNDEGIFNAQIRMLSESVLNLHEKGHLDSLPQLSNSNQNDSNILKLVKFNEIQKIEGAK